MDDMGEPKAFRVLCVRISTQASHSNICRDSLLIPPELCASAMDNNCSFSFVAPTLTTAATVTAHPFYYLVPVVVLAHEPTVVRPEEKAPIADSCGRRVTTTWSSDGHAYSRRQTAVRVARMEQPPLPPTVKTREEDKDGEMLARITKTLLNLLEDHEAQLPFRRRLRNAKLPRSAVMWTRVVKKALLLLRNNRAPVRDLLSEHKPYL